MVGLVLELVQLPDEGVAARLGLHGTAPAGDGDTDVVDAGQGVRSSLHDGVQRRLELARLANLLGRLEEGGADLWSWTHGGNLAFSRETRQTNA